MSYHNGFSILDRAEILQLIFYSRRDTRGSPLNSTDCSVPVEGGISVGCRFYVHSHSAPSILLFHGNGEIVNDYDSIIPITEVRGLFANAASESKRLVIIKDADHNDIMLVGMEEYFKAIKEFILENKG